MGLIGNIVTFFIIWWVVIFAVLPWGVHRLKNPEKGMEHGAPEKPLILRKLLLTTGISIILWGTLKYLIENDFLTLDLFPF